VHKPQPDQKTANISTAQWLLFQVGLLASLIAGASCGPEVLTLERTLRPPDVRYTTMTLTPTITLTASITPTSIPTDTPYPTATFTPTATATATSTPTSTLTPTPFHTRVPGATHTPQHTYAPLIVLPEAHFWLHRPIPEAGQDYLAPTYRYGSTQGGTLRPHHGVDFENERGTPVLSADTGSVVFAGADAESMLGPEYDFYGKAVVVLSQRAFLHQPVYILYGHLETITVSVGQLLKAGTQLGTVGGSGVAKGGSHLHLEVRVGHNDYTTTRNPELWLLPYPDWGTLAGRVTDRNGELLPLANVTVRSDKLDAEDADPLRRYLTTYVIETINPDELLGENFTIADLPPGSYTVSVNTGHKAQTQKVAILPDRLTWVEFRNVLPPATWTPTLTTTPTPQ